jgi:hypothetical protein
MGTASPGAFVVTGHQPLVDLHCLEARSVAHLVDRGPGLDLPDHRQFVGGCIVLHSSVTRCCERPAQVGGPPPYGYPARRQRPAPGNGCAAWRLPSWSASFRRGAHLYRVHFGRQSRRSVSAIDPAGRSDLFDDKDPSGISEIQALALQVVDAFVWQLIQWPPGLGEKVVDSLGPAATELTLDIVRNAANKIAVAFDADDPQVKTGVEYYDIDASTGELRYNVSPVTLRA